MPKPIYVTGSIPTSTKNRIHTWIDTDRLVYRYGIQAKIGRRWHHVLKGNEFLLFDTEAEARAALSGEEK